MDVMAVLVKCQWQIVSVTQGRHEAELVGRRLKLTQPLTYHAYYYPAGGETSQLPLG